MISMLPLEVHKGFSITAKPLLVHTDGAPLVPNASQAYQRFEELGFLKHVTLTTAQWFYL